MLKVDNARKLLGMSLSLPWLLLLHLPGHSSLLVEKGGNKKTNSFPELVYTLQMSAGGWTALGMKPHDLLPSHQRGLRAGDANQPL